MAHAADLYIRTLHRKTPRLQYCARIYYYYIVLTENIIITTIVQ